MRVCRGTILIHHTALSTLLRPFIIDVSSAQLHWLSPGLTSAESGENDQEKASKFIVLSLLRSYLEGRRRSSLLESSPHPPRPSLLRRSACLHGNSQSTLSFGISSISGSATQTSWRVNLSDTRRWPQSHHHHRRYQLPSSTLSVVGHRPCQPPSSALPAPRLVSLFYVAPAACYAAAESRLPLAGAVLSPLLRLISRSSGAAAQVSVSSTEASSFSASVQQSSGKDVRGAFNYT